MTVNGSGMFPPDRAYIRNGTTSGGGVREDVHDELADVVVDTTTRGHRGDDGGEVVVGQHHRRRLPGHVGAVASHRDTDVRPAQRGCVVDPPVPPGHRHHLAQIAQRVGDPQFGLGGGGAGEDQFGAALQEPVEFGLGHRIQIGSADHLESVMGADAHTLGDPPAR